jgi:hypothetical protein
LLLRSIAARENRGAVKRSSPQKRAERRERRFKDVKLKERKARFYRQVRDYQETKRQHTLALMQDGNDDVD